VFKTYHMRTYAWTTRSCIYLWMSRFVDFDLKLTSLKVNCLRVFSVCMGFLFITRVSMMGFLFITRVYDYDWHRGDGYGDITVTVTVTVMMASRKSNVMTVTVDCRRDRDCEVRACDITCLSSRVGCWSNAKLCWTMQIEFGWHVQLHHGHGNIY
jgi:hypothetical protein